MHCQSLSELAQVISLNTKIVEDYYLDNSLPVPSIDVDGPCETAIRDENAAAARCTVLGAIHQLKCLMLGPKATLMAVEVRLSMSTYDLFVPHHPHRRLIVLVRRYAHASSNIPLQN